MTEPAPGPHPDLDTLAELDEGLHDGTPDEARLRGHVGRCTVCAEEVSRLRQVRIRLAELPPPPLPADVASRLDTALNDAAAARPSHHRPRWLPAAAVAAGIAVLLAAGIAALSARPGPSRPSSAPTPAAAPAEGTVVATGRNYSSASLAADVRALVAHPQPVPKAAAQSTRSAGAPQMTAERLARARDRLTDRGQLTECVSALAGRPGVRPLAVDYAWYEGRAAVVIVLPDADPQILQAWVVAPGCSPGNPQVLDHEQVRRSA